MVTDAVVCARGERARTFVPVVRALRAGAGGRVFLVDDGRNRGLWRARLAGARVVRGPRRGKGAAMAAGLARVRTDRVVFADADTRGLTRAHVAALVRHGDGMTCGLRHNGSRWLGPVPPVTGERCLPVALARSARLDGYGAEMALDAAAGNAGIPVRHVTLTGLTNPSKAPLARTAQVLREIPRHVLGLARYVAGWIVTAIGALAWG